MVAQVDFGQTDKMASTITSPPYKANRSIIWLQLSFVKFCLIIS